MRIDCGGGGCFFFFLGGEERKIQRKREKFLWVKRELVRKIEKK